MGTPGAGGGSLHRQPGVGNLVGDSVRPLVENSQEKQRIAAPCGTAAPVGRGGGGAVTSG